MTILPPHRRPYRAFLSYAHADKEAVERVLSWLRDVADVPIWYDSNYLPGGTAFEKGLSDAIANSQGMIIMLSAAALASEWVGYEKGAALEHHAQSKNFGIWPVRLEECTPPGFLANFNYVDVFDGRLDLRSAQQLLGNFYDTDIDLEMGRTKDVYMSRSWREAEATLPEHIAKLLDKAGFRLIGDSENQSRWDERRIESLVDSCGALVAVLPYRAEAPTTTSPYILEEIGIAQRLGLPCLVIAEPSVEIPGYIHTPALRMTAADTEIGPMRDSLNSAVDSLATEQWRRPARPRYIFFATTIAAKRGPRNQAIKQLVQVVTAMPCIMGADIQENPVQQTIARRIGEAFLTIADISGENLNTCIEAGIALGAGSQLQLLAKGRSQKLPFMFRDQQVLFYQDDVELLGKIHKVLQPHRRRVLNRELKR